jgi:deazaflavin-dependent oxidoreductase (nitroreductase family)
MSAGDFKDAAREASEVNLTVTGRKSGRESTRPIWFVEEGERVLLLPVGGANANWYRNVVATPEITLAIDGSEFRATAKPVEDASVVADTLDKFSAKYGADQVEQYYPNQDATVEVPLG